MNWQKRLAWGAGILVLLLVFLAAAAYFVLRSSAFHNFVIAKAEEAANKTTGGHLQVGNYQAFLNPLGVKLYGVVLRGTELTSQPPLFTADELDVNLKIVSFLKHKVDLRGLSVVHPVVNLAVSKDGNSNLPKPPKSSGSSTNVFDLGIDHASIRNGEIYYNDRSMPLDADLHDLEARVQYKILGSSYDGSISYDRGHLQFGSFDPLPHSLRAHFNATRSEFKMESLLLSIGNSQLSSQINLVDYSQPKIDAAYRILLDSTQFREITHNPSLPAGTLLLNGSLRYSAVPGQPALQNATLHGQLNSSDLLVDTPDVRAAISGIHAEYVLANGELRVRNARAAMLGARVETEATMTRLLSTPVSYAKVSVRGLSLRAAEAALRNRSMRGLPLSATVDAQSEVEWHGSLQGLNAHVDGTLRGAVERGSKRSAVVPLNGTFHIAYDQVRNLITVRETQIHTPQTQLVAAGTASKQSKLSLQVQSHDLHELELLAASFRTPEPGQAAPAPIDLHGTATLDAQVTGAMQNPRIAGQLSAQNLQVRQSHWRSLRTGFQASSNGASVSNGNLVSASQGKVQFSANVGLRKWQYLPANPVSLDLTADRLAAAQLLSAANLQYPVRGDLSAKLKIRGSQLNPSGNGTLQLSRAEVASIPVQTLTVNFNGNGNEIQSSTHLLMPAGSAKADLNFAPRTQAYRFQLQVPAIRLNQIPKLQPMQVSGVLTADAQGAGTLKDPQLQMSASVPQLQVRGKTISGLSSHLNVSDQKAKVDLSSTVANAAYLKANGTVNLTGNKYAEIRLDTNDVPIAALIAAYASQPVNQLSGTLELHATASGPLSTPEQMQAWAEIPVLKLTYGSFNIGNAGPIRANYRNGAIALEHTELRGTGTDLVLQGVVPIRGSAPASMNANGDVDLSILQMFTPDISSAGKLTVAMNATGSASNPGLQGQIRISNGTFASSTAPVGVDNLNAVLRVQNNRLQIEQFAANSGGGTLSAHGFVDYRPSLAFDLGLKADNIRLLYPDGVRTVSSADLSFVGSPQASNLGGRVVVENLSFTPAFDLTSLGGSGGPEGAPGASPGMSNNIKLDIAVQSAGQLYAQSSQLNLQGNLNLRVQGTAADPVILGRADLSGGEAFFLGRRFQIQRATAEFNNPIRTEPTLNALVTTTVNQYNLSITLLGPLSRLRTNYVSDPPLPPVDVINLLARGQTTEQPSTSNFDANSVIAQGLASQVGSQVQQLAGISSLQIDPLIGGSNQNPSATLAIQQRVTKNFFFTFSTDVTSTQDQVVQGEYQLNKRWSVSGVRNQNGDIGFDARFHTEF